MGKPELKEGDGLLLMFLLPVPVLYYFSADVQNPQKHT